MNEIRLRITTYGTVCGLWTDEVQFQELGPVQVTRASHVEFDNRLQCWTVRAADSRNALRRLAGRVFRRPQDCVLHRALSRADALAWEREYFEPGGAGWSTAANPNST